ncbi:hypothetical protein [Chryseobacterium sp. Hurlbut01]|uniref:hypothetical protein n=1 Tax=Chryseobacterium sp. Hurlbut01 TaxID=1681828 RepID=UPI00067D1FEF|nr:hypothetical protein [Chryseobacterium sp. Hurlbut01]KNB61217.1 hypothetical protein AC804_11645 [Chryseobacterium sp. Hurlbut01]
MKKYLLMIFITVFSLSFGQKTLNAKIITKENDTLNVKIKVSTNAFDPTLLYVTSFNTKVTVIEDDGKKTKIEVPKIKELFLTDFNGKERAFINKSSDQKILLERLYDGENLEWYRTYSSTMGGENANDFLFNKKTKKGIGFIYFTGLPKRKLKDFFSDEPEMLKILENTDKGGAFAHTSEYDNGMLSLIQKFEELKKE